MQRSSAMISTPLEIIVYCLVCVIQSQACANFPSAHDAGVDAVGTPDSVTKYTSYVEKVKGFIDTVAEAFSVAKVQETVPDATILRHIWITKKLYTSTPYKIAVELWGVRVSI